MLRRVFSSYNKFGVNLTSYKSSIALDNLYPNSTLNISKSPSIPENEIEKFSGYIPMDKIKVSHCASSGAGGQNVNVLNTKVEVRFHLDTAEWIPESIRDRMRTKVRSSLTKTGFIYITSERTRHQHMNLADALEKLRELIRSCEPIQLSEPSSETIEFHRKRTEKSARERLRQKRHVSSIKSTRGAASIDS